MRRRVLRAFGAYGAALAAVALSAGVCQALWPFMQYSPSSPFFAAVMLSAWLGGLGPGLVASGLAAIVLEFAFMPPFRGIAIDIADVVRIAVFLGVAVLISSLNSQRRKSEERLRRAHADLEQRVAERTHELATAKTALEAEIVERRRSEDSVRQSEERYRVLFEGNPHPTWLVDSSTARMLAVNDAAVRAYGFSREEFLGMSMADVQASGMAPVLGPAAGGRRAEKHRRRDGTIIDVEITVNAVTVDGAPAFLVLADDVTERARLELQLRHLQKMEAIGRLAGGVAHDFNNLLSVMIVRSEYLLARHGHDDALRADLQLLLGTAERAEALVQQLLAYSRRQLLQPRVVDLNRVVDGLAMLLRRLVPDDIEIVFVPGGDVGHVLADPGQVEQVLVNLVANARDAMPRGGRLIVETSGIELGPAVAPPGLAPGRYAMLAVTDTGIGMDDETRARVFDPFFTTKDAGKGTGLGLAVVYGIVKQHGGDIVVDSRLGAGSRFVLYLPAATPPAGSDPAEAGAEPLRGSEVVLIVEDDAEVREVARLVLGESGYRTLLATDGAEALDVAARYPEKIDLLLTDVLLPGIDGPEVARRLRRSRPDTRVLFMSAYTEERAAVLEAAHRLLKKPFRRRTLLAAVRAALDRAELAAM